MISTIINALIAIASFSAIYIYLIEKYNKKKTAATLIVIQIEYIENEIRSMRESGRMDDLYLYTVHELIDTNYWNKYKYLLSKNLGNTNIKLLEDFYLRVEQIEKSRRIILESITETWNSKELVFQQHLAEEIKKFGNDFDIDNSFLKDYERCPHCFSAQLPKDHLIKNLNLVNYISGTTAYEKLKKMAYGK